jgi:hypothetical protein
MKNKLKELKKLKEFYQKYNKIIMDYIVIWGVVLFCYLITKDSDVWVVKISQNGNLIKKIYFIEAMVWMGVILSFISFLLEYKRLKMLKLYDKLYKESQENKEK